ncbi:electron carrier/ protein disulfide oxidoreductase [Anaeramoeba ignava]|uniref:Electron carrier/ protein disulfide oxidoreductase n=1 Tax=Anaeramoeba ignava TaxID=1746090 RepID=A0A9Q0LTP0_ANAIG|nr:electron carrier/ protein disulfide oxidoreductase [Anaeramoeba ignava]
MDLTKKLDEKIQKLQNLINSHQKQNETTKKLKRKIDRFTLRLKEKIVENNHLRNDLKEAESFYQGISETKSIPFEEKEKKEFLDPKQKIQKFNEKIKILNEEKETLEKNQYEHLESKYQNVQNQLNDYIAANNVLRNKISEAKIHVEKLRTQILHSQEESNKIESTSPKKIRKVNDEKQHSDEYYQNKMEKLQVEIEEISEKKKFYEEMVNNTSTSQKIQLIQNLQKQIREKTSENNKIRQNITDLVSRSEAQEFTESEQLEFIFVDKPDDYTENSDSLTDMRKPSDKISAENMSPLNNFHQNFQNLIPDSIKNTTGQSDSPPQTTTTTGLEFYELDTETESPNDLGEKHQQQQTQQQSQQSQQSPQSQPEDQNIVIDFDTLEQLLEIPQANEYFKEFLSQQLNQENIIFYNEIREFQQLQDPKKLEKWSISIYEKYIKPESIFEINIDSKSRAEITQKIKNREFSTDIFNKAKNIILTLMEHNAFMPFKTSSLYEQLLVKISIGATYNPLSSIKSATIVSKQKNQLSLNSARKYKGNPRNPLGLSIKLMKFLIDLLYANFLTTTTQIDCDILSQSIPFRRFVVSTYKLQNIKLKGLSSNIRKAFFINIFNCMYLHGSIINGPPSDKTTYKKFMKNTKYHIGSDLYSLSDIKHGILRGNIGSHFKENDKRIELVVPADPRIHFAILSFDTPLIPVQFFHETQLDDELTDCCQNYLSLNVRISQQKILVPRVFSLYSKDFGKTQLDIVLWVLHYFMEDNKIGDFDPSKPFSIKHPQQTTSSIILIPEQKIEEKI